MSKETDEILKQFAEQLEKDLKAKVPVASGKTRDSIHTVFEKKGFTIFGGAQISAIIDGRKPTKRGAKKGTPTLQQLILMWIRERSIRPRESNMSLKSLSWAMANSIHMNGYRGQGNIFETVLTKSRFNSLTKSLLKQRTVEIKSDVVKEIKFV